MRPRAIRAPRADLLYSGGMQRRTALLTGCLACAPRAVRAATCKPPGAIDAGPVPAIGATRLVEADVRLLVARDASGVYAMSGMCTHMGGALFLEPDGTSRCPAHDSRFGKNGELLKGPAQRALNHFAVRLCDGRVWVDPTTVVPADSRTPP